VKELVRAVLVGEVEDGGIGVGGHYHHGGGGGDSIGGSP